MIIEAERHGCIIDPLSGDKAFLDSLTVLALFMDSAVCNNLWFSFVGGCNLIPSVEINRAALQESESLIKAKCGDGCSLCLETNYSSTAAHILALFTELLSITCTAMKHLLLSKLFIQKRNSFYCVRVTI